MLVLIISNFEKNIKQITTKFLLEIHGFLNFLPPPHSIFFSKQNCERKWSEKTTKLLILLGEKPHQN